MATKKTTQKPAKTQKRTKESPNPCCNHHIEAARDNCKLNDYDIISDVLGSHKNLIKLYGTALCETDSENLRKIINTQMTECAVDQYDAFRYMNERGMYKVEPAPVQKVKSAKVKFGKNIEQFGNNASKLK